YVNSYLSSTDPTMMAFGAWIGNRYKDYPNVIWILGGDANPNISGLSTKIQGLGNGLAAADPNHLITMEGCPVGICSTTNNSSITYWSPSAPPAFITLNGDYSQFGQAQ